MIQTKTCWIKDRKSSPSIVIVSSAEYDLIVPTEFSKLYKLFLVILNLFRTSFRQMKLVYDAFLDLFSIFFPCLKKVVISFA